jgi:hypothetical protein
MKKHLLNTVAAGMGVLLLSTPIAAQEVTGDLLAIAAKVHTGALLCEGKQMIMLWPDKSAVGRFVLKMNKSVYRLTAVPTESGAVRLEDEQTGAIWIQTLEKSMLMDSRRSKRLADECQSPAQKTAAQQTSASGKTDLLEAHSNDR